jgi:hypothetical protein
MDENNSSSTAASKFFLHAPAPWQLEGEGIILVYKFSKKWVETFGQLPPELIEKFKGGLGYIMLVNYKNSPVGPYRELLFIPGKFSPHGKQSITKIYVDSEASTQNGRANWGIPKNTLPISWEEENGKISINIISGDRPVFSCEVSSFGLPFPTSTSFLPLDLHQVLNNMDYFTKPTGSGWGKFAKVKIKEIDSAYFPDIRSRKPLFAVKINPFRINFPTPEYDL